MPKKFESATHELNALRNTASAIKAVIEGYMEEGYWKNCRYAKGCVNACGIGTEAVLKKILEELKGLLDD